MYLLSHYIDLRVNRRSLFLLLNIWQLKNCHILWQNPFYIYMISTLTTKNSKFIKILIFNDLGWSIDYIYPLMYNVRSYVNAYLYRPTVRQFFSQISRLVNVNGGLIWFFVWSIIRISCLHFLRSYVYFLFIGAGAFVSVLTFDFILAIKPPSSCERD